MNITRDTMSNNAISYSRFSSNLQTELSIQRQQKLAKDYCKAHNLNLIQNLSDHGISAFSGKNAAPDAALGHLMSQLQTGNIKTPIHLIIESLDRLSRESIPVVLPKFMDLINNNVIIHTITDKQVYSLQTINNDWTKLIVSLAVMARAHDESKVKSDRQKAYWNRVREGGKAVGGILPAYMTKSTDNRELHPEHSKTVLLIIDKCLSGIGIRTIIRQLNETNTPSFTKSNRWTISYIGTLLRNPALSGHYSTKATRPYPEQWIRDWFPALIDDNKFQQIQHALNQNKLNRGKRVIQDNANLLSGIASCGHCSAPIHHHKTYNKYKHYYYLSCRDSMREGTCPTKNYRKSEVERALFKALAHHMLYNGYQQHDTAALNDELHALTRLYQSILVHHFNGIDG